MQKYSGESTRGFTKHSNCESAIINRTALSEIRNKKKTF